METAGDTLSGQAAPSADPWEAENAFRTVFEGSGNPMVLFDGELRLREANDAASKFLQTPRESLRGRSIRDFVPPAQATRLPTLLSELLAEGHLEASYEAMLPDGSQGPIEFSAVANVRPGRHVAIVHPGWERVGTGAENTGSDDHDGGKPRAEGSFQTETPSLSRRELEVVQGLAMGINGPDLSKSLGISYETVRVHSRNAMRKLGARTQAHAIALALKQGLITPPRHNRP